jgi:hypothetical protein
MCRLRCVRRYAILRNKERVLSPGDDIIASIVITLMFALWYAAIAAKAIAAYRIASNGLIARFPAVWAYLVAAGVQSIALIAVRQNTKAYAAIYGYSSPLVLCLEGVAVVGVFWSLTEFYPNFRVPGSIILGALATCGALISLATRVAGLSADWGSPQRLMLLDRCCTLAMAVVLLGTWAFLPRLKAIPIRRSASRAALITGVQVFLHFANAAYLLLAGTSIQVRMIGSLVPVAGGLLTSILWAVCLTRESDECPVVERFPPGAYEERVAADAAWMDAFERTARRILRG